MDKALKELIKIMPPLENSRYSKVDWERLEARVGLRYPDSFKDYVAVYGGTVWCGTWCPFYNVAESDDELDDFMATEREKVSGTNGTVASRYARSLGLGDR